MLVNCLLKRPQDVVSRTLSLTLVVIFQERKDEKRKCNNLMTRFLMWFRAENWNGLENQTNSAMLSSGTWLLISFGNTAM